MIRYIYHKVYKYILIHTCICISNVTKSIEQSAEEEEEEGTKKKGEGVEYLIAIETSDRLQQSQRCR